MNIDTSSRTVRVARSPAAAVSSPPQSAGVGPSPPPRYYTPPPQPMAAYERKRSNRTPEESFSTNVALHNIVTVTSGHGGVGLSVMASMLALTLTERGQSCVLVDADFVAGCLDLLLGLEREPGLRFSQIDAPLGRIEGAALRHELIDWEGIRVLPCDPWSTRQPEWWEVQAVIRALAETHDIVIVDAGQGGLIETVSDLRHGVQVMAAELSVIGLARAKAHRLRLSAWECGIPHIVGIEPRGTPRGRGSVDVAEAEDYLSAAVVGPIRLTSSLCGDVLEGLGIRSVPKRSRKAIEALADAVERDIRAGARAA